MRDKTGDITALMSPVTRQRRSVDLIKTTSGLEDVAVRHERLAGRSPGVYENARAELVQARTFCGKSLNLPRRVCAPMSVLERVRSDPRSPTDYVLSTPM